MNAKSPSSQHCQANDQPKTVRETTKTILNVYPVTISCLRWWKERSTTDLVDLFWKSMACRAVRPNINSRKCSDWGLRCPNDRDVLPLIMDLWSPLVSISILYDIQCVPVYWWNAYHVGLQVAQITVPQKLVSIRKLDQWLIIYFF